MFGFSINITIIIFIIKKSDSSSYKQVYLFRIPDNDLVICLSRGMDQLQGDASKVYSQAVREHLLNSLLGNWPKRTCFTKTKIIETVVIVTRQW